MELRKRAASLPDDYLVVLVGDMITEEALPTYMAMLNTLDGVRDQTGAEQTPWGRCDSCCAVLLHASGHGWLGRCAHHAAFGMEGWTLCSFMPRAYAPICMAALFLSSLCCRCVHSSVTGTPVLF